MPRDLFGPAPISENTHRWLGRAAVLVKESVDDLIGMDYIGFTTAVDHMQGAVRERCAHQIVAILHRALARAEMKAPAAAQGAFIPVGAVFDVFQAVGKVLRGATQNILMVDAYMGPKVLTDFAPLAPERVVIRLLADSFSTKPETLRPPAERWAQQYGTARPFEIRLTAPRLLHDRLIIVDGGQVWSLTQSLEHFAGRSPASVLRVENEIAAQKVIAYGQLWNGAQAL